MNNITEYNDVNKVLDELVDKLQQLLGKNMLAFYVHGSMALGDFDPATSDIDFMVVIEKKLIDKEIEQIEKLHQQLIAGDNEWGRKLEGSYITKDQLQSKEPPVEPRPYLNEKNFYSGAEYGYEWVLEKYVVREKGLVLFGPAPDEFIDRVEVDEVIEAVKKIFEENWQPMLTDAKKLESEWYRPYTILTLCRILYTAEKGKIGSKREAAEWVMENFGDRWGDMVQLAVQWKRGDGFGDIGKIIKMVGFVGDFLKKF